MGPQRQTADPTQAPARYYDHGPEVRRSSTLVVTTYPNGAAIGNHLRPDPLGLRTPPVRLPPADFQRLRGRECEFEGAATVGVDYGAELHAAHGIGKSST